MFQPLNRDPPDGQSQWELNVTASDGVHESHMKVLVNLKDVNDNKPFFPQEIVRTVISESTPEGNVFIVFKLILSLEHFLSSTYFFWFNRSNKLIIMKVCALYTVLIAICVEHLIALLTPQCF